MSSVRADHSFFSVFHFYLFIQHYYLVFLFLLASHNTQLNTVIDITCFVVIKLSSSCFTHKKNNTRTYVNQLLREEFHQQILWPKTLNTYCSCTVLVPTYDIHCSYNSRKSPGGGGVKNSPHKNFVSFVSFLYFFVNLVVIVLPLT